MFEIYYIKRMFLNTMLILTRFLCVLYQAKQKLSTAGVNSLALLIKKLLIIVSRPSRLLECLVIAATPCFSTQGTLMVHRVHSWYTAVTFSLFIMDNFILNR